MKGKIKKGTKVFQDFRTFIYPNLNQKLDVETVFDIKDMGNAYVCVAHGFGHKSDYGNGSIFVFDKNKIIIIS